MTAVSVKVARMLRRTFQEMGFDYYFMPDTSKYQGAPAARDLLLQLHHAKIPLSLVVVERHPQVLQEPQHLDPVAVQP